MAWPIVTVASGGLPVTEAGAFGAPVEEATNGYGTPVTFVTSGGLPVTKVGLPYGAGSFAGILLGNSEASGLALDFANQSALVRGGSSQYLGTPGGLLTYTAPSQKWVYDITGTLVQTAVNALPYDYDPITHAAPGTLVEEQRTNIALRSQEFDNAVWTRGAGATVTANAATAPDGTLTADLFTCTSPHSDDLTGYVQQQVTSVAGAVTHSVYVSPKSWRWLRVGIYDGAWKKAYFDLQNGLTGSVTAGVTSSIKAVGNGWFRCSVTFTAAGANVYGGFLLVDADNSDVQAASSGANGVYLWGAQLE